MLYSTRCTIYMFKEMRGGGEGGREGECVCVCVCVCRCVCLRVWCVERVLQQARCCCARPWARASACATLYARARRLRPARTRAHSFAGRVKCLRGEEKNKRPANCSARQLSFEQCAFECVPMMRKGERTLKRRQYINDEMVRIRWTFEAERAIYLSFSLPLPLSLSFLSLLVSFYHSVYVYLSLSLPLSLSLLFSFSVSPLLSLSIPLFTFIFLSLSLFSTTCGKLVN